ncbi:MAG: CDP-alcohol phosphatidyltransferase family protein [Epsilonproteobacteria bacterium]|nr:MAG: CDP-alcohol phosphatidyltransferase family protein [Campylobacterota bacterium]RLA65162.1 MAG: CDP-alcohol phosphatidyltransferase family protein [Campylobacterota bacterium]
MNTKFERLWETKNKNDEWWSSFITAPLAILLNYLVVDLKFLTPNILTILSFAVSCFAAILILIGTYPAVIMAAIFIHLGHIFDCMDGQMARYRGLSSTFGSYFDKVTDQIKVFILWGAFAYTAYQQTQNILVIFLAFIGVSFYYLRGYVKYVALYLNTSKVTSEQSQKIATPAGPGSGMAINLKWLLKEQPKFFDFDEGVFIFLLSFGLIFDQMVPILWIFAIGQVYYGIYRSWQRGSRIYYAQDDVLLSPIGK